MKNLLLLTLLVICFGTVSAQRIVAGVQSELTVTGLQYGGTLAYETSGLWAYGGFYQTGVEKNSESKSRNYFYGALLQAPVARTEKLAFFVNLRMGLVNNRFAAVTPGLETRIYFGRRLGLGIGMSMRMNYPSISSKLIVKLF